MKPTSKDPCERVLEQAFIDAGIPYQRHDEKYPNLDFYLPSYDVYVEVKRFHSERIQGQMARVPNVIAIQGMEACLTFAKLIGGFLLHGGK